MAALAGSVAVGHLALPPQLLPSGQPVRLPPRPPSLAGREDLLASLARRLSVSEIRGPQIVALHGLAGAGKTSVAVEYAHRHLAEVGIAWQFASEDTSVLAAGFDELAAQLGARNLLEVRNPVATVHALLAAHEREWLLVFDNAPDRESVEAFLPPAGRGRVLVTSQNSNWPPSQGMEVPVLDAETARSFLVNRTGDQDRHAARDLALELGGLPLALEQAAAYIQASAGTLASYLLLFRQRTRDMLARGEPTGYGKTVAATWSLAFGQLETGAPSAVALLRLLAWCAPEATPLNLLLQPHPALLEAHDAELAPGLMPLLQDPVTVTDALAALSRYSLIIPAGPGAVSVHRLVQAVTVNQMPADLAAQWHQSAAALIESAIPADADAPGQWSVCDALLPHAEVALADDSPGMGRLANYLGARGNYAAVLDIQRRVLDAKRRVHGDEHQDTLLAWRTLAFWTGRGGDAIGARDQYAELLPIHERVLGPEDPETLAIQHNLAYWTAGAGDVSAAWRQFADLLALRERVLGPEHPDTLATRHNLVRWAGEAGMRTDGHIRSSDSMAGEPTASRASSLQAIDTQNRSGWRDFAATTRDQFVKLLRVREHEFGSEHPEALAIRHNLANLTGWAGDAHAARDQFADLASIRARVLGPDHPDTLNSRHNTAFWAVRAGDAAGARDEYAELLPLRERVLGAEHPSTLTTRHNLANATGLAGNAAAARDQYAELLGVRRRVLGAEHPGTLTTRHNLARWTGEAGDAAAARDQFTELLAVRERVLGLNHKDTLVTREALTYWNEKVSKGQ